MEASTADPVEQPVADERALIAKAAAERAGQKSQLTPVEQDAATAWLLSDDPEDEVRPVTVMELNLGSDDAPKRVKWTVGSIGPDQLRRAQQRARRVGGRDGDDEFETHLWVVVEASISPNVAEVAKQKGAPNPARFLKDRFHSKPGMITQIAVEVMRISGFDDSHVQVEAGKP